MCTHTHNKKEKITAVFAFLKFFAEIAKSYILNCYANKKKLYLFITREKESNSQKSTRMKQMLMKSTFINTYICNTHMRYKILYIYI